MKLKHLKLSRVYIWLVSNFFKKWWLVAIVIALFLVSFVTAKGLSFFQRYNVKPVDLLNFIGNPVEKLDSSNNVTNFLLLGIRGEGDDSPLLSDTIIVFSYDHETNTGTLLSIPRDLWVPSLKAKINTAYFYGTEKQSSPSGGIKMAEGAILETTGLPINYTAVVDFSLFKGVIDLLGGVDVYNDTAFTDNEFPIPGKENAYPVSSRYETISFPAGMIHMNGETALKFVRSRHAEGEEGTDFARSRRQQALLEAIRKKVLTPDFLLNQDKVTQLFDLINSKLVTNMEPKLYPTLARLALNMQGKTVRSIGLSNVPDENGITVLYNPPTSRYFGEWVLIPKDNNWNALKQYVKNRMSGTQ